jgi:glycosyltransferase involved in cell wall biosynthesis
VYTVEYGFNSSLFVGEGYAKKSQAQRRANNFHFGTLARLSVEKDLKTFISAASLLSGQDGLNFQFKIFGDGPLHRELEQNISDLGMRDHVQLCGRTMNPAQVLSTFDVFVLTSQFEGFGMVLLEAMSVGLPIICSKISTSVEILGESGAAVFFEPGNAADLSEKMRRISEHLDSDFQLEQAKRLELYNSKVMLAKINNVYKKIGKE